VHRALAAGPLAWDGRDRSGRPAPSGLYLVRIERSGRIETFKALRLR
jgi:hypothetical protein